ncbi:hypothetical protein C0995_009953 [Termitomyces sp. Mi166|nr:hypothetical protein C0995_009953 [Termitomyces sp. Mi166\
MAALTRNRRSRNDITLPPLFVQSHAPYLTLRHTLSKEWLIPLRVFYLIVDLTVDDLGDNIELDLHHVDHHRATVVDHELRLADDVDDTLYYRYHHVDLDNRLNIDHDSRHHHHHFNAHNLADVDYSHDHLHIHEHRPHDFRPGRCHRNFAPASGSAAPSTNKGFFDNKGAVAGVFTVVGLAVLALLILLVATIIRRRRAKQFDREVAAAAAEAAAASAPDFEDDDDDDTNNPYAHHTDHHTTLTAYTDHPPTGPRQYQ